MFASLSELQQKPKFWLEMQYIKETFHKNVFSDDLRRKFEALEDIWEPQEEIELIVQRVGAGVREGEGEGEGEKPKEYLMLSPLLPTQIARVLFEEIHAKILPFLQAGTGSGLVVGEEFLQIIPDVKDQANVVFDLNAIHALPLIFRRSHAIKPSSPASSLMLSRAATPKHGASKPPFSHSHSSGHARHVSCPTSAQPFSAPAESSPLFIPQVMASAAASPLQLTSFYPNHYNSPPSASASAAAASSSSSSSSSYSSFMSQLDDASLSMGSSYLYNGSSPPVLSLANSEVQSGCPTGIASVPEESEQEMEVLGMLSSHELRFNNKDNLLQISGNYDNAFLKLFLQDWIQTQQEKMTLHAFYHNNSPYVNLEADNFAHTLALSTYLMNEFKILPNTQEIYFMKEIPAQNSLNTPSRYSIFINEFFLRKQLAERYKDQAIVYPECAGVHEGQYLFPIKIQAMKASHDQNHVIFIIPKRSSMKNNNKMESTTRAMNQWIKSLKKNNLISVFSCDKDTPCHILGERVQDVEDNIDDLKTRIQEWFFLGESYSGQIHPSLENIFTEILRKNNNEVMKLFIILDDLPSSDKGYQKDNTFSALTFVKELKRQVNMLKKIYPDIHKRLTITLVGLLISENACKKFKEAIQNRGEIQLQLLDIKKLEQLESELKKCLPMEYAGQYTWQAQFNDLQPSVFTAQFNILESKVIGIAVEQLKTENSEQTTIQCILDIAGNKQNMTVTLVKDKAIASLIDAYKQQTKMKGFQKSLPLLLSGFSDRSSTSPIRSAQGSSSSPPIVANTDPAGTDAGAGAAVAATKPHSTISTSSM